MKSRKLVAKESTDAKYVSTDVLERPVKERSHALATGLRKALAGRGIRVLESTGGKVIIQLPTQERRMGQNDAVDDTFLRTVLPSFYEAAKAQGTADFPSTPSENEIRLRKALKELRKASESQGQKP